LFTTRHEVQETIARLGKERAISPSGGISLATQNSERSDLSNASKDKVEKEARDPNRGGSIPPNKTSRVGSSALSSEMTDSGVRRKSRTKTNHLGTVEMTKKSSRRKDENIGGGGIPLAAVCRGGHLPRTVAAEKKKKKFPQGAHNARMERKAKIAKVRFRQIKANHLAAIRGGG